jgi:hypothetical protein
VSSPSVHDGEEREIDLLLAWPGEGVAVIEA